MMWFLFFLVFQTDPEQVRFEEARRLAQQGGCHEAETELKQLAEAHPQNFPMRFALGRCHFDEKNYLAAIDSFRLAVQLDPKMVEARCLYGASLGLSGRTGEAVEQLRQATKMDRDFALSFRLLGMFEVESGQAGLEARDALQRAVSLDSSDARAHYWLGKLYLLNKSYDEAVVEFSASLGIQPGSIQALLGHAQALAGNGMTDTALDEFQTVLETDPSMAAARLGLASCLYDLQRFPEALKAAQDAIPQVTNEQDRRAALWLLSRLYRAVGDPAKSIENEQLLAGLEHATNVDLARFRELQEQAMRYREAHEFAKVASTLEAALLIEQRQDSLVMLGDAYQALNRWRDAEQSYVRALAAGPEQQAIARRLENVRSALEAAKK